MDFLITRNIDVESAAEKIFDLRLNHTDTQKRIISRGPIRVFTTGTTEKIDTACAIRIFDGQCSHKGIFYHKFLDRKAELMDDLVDSILSRDEMPNNGVFCIAKIDGGSEPTITVLTDWLGQYPVYYWRSAGKFAISNNILMIQAVVPATRSLWPAVQNIVCGGSLGATHLAEIERIPFGTIIKGGQSLSIESRSDHDMPALTYDTALEHAKGEIASHIDALCRAGGLNYIADITGGADSRSVLSFLVPGSRRFRIDGRSLTQYPSPDANVAAYLMDHYDIKPGKVPVCGVNIEKMVRQNAALSGGARDCGSVGSPIAFTNLVQFRGCYGEIGGATPGADYISLAAQEGNYSHQKAIDILLARRRMARALDLVTDDALQSTANSLIKSLETLEAKGYAREHLISEMYLRTRCRTHFGLSTYIENQSRILPDPLANRWLVEARRLLPAKLHTNNKVIFDLIVKNDHVDLAFMSMADKKWNKSIVPEELQDRWAEMNIVNFQSARLSELNGQLYEKVSFPDPDGTSFKSLVKLPPMTQRPTHAQGGYIAPYQALLRYFVDNVDTTDDVWDYFSRDRVIEYVNRSPDEFTASGIDINAMGTVAAGISWKLGLEIAPRVSKAQLLPS